MNRLPVQMLKELKRIKGKAKRLKLAKRSEVLRQVYTEKISELESEIDKLSKEVKNDERSIKEFEKPEWVNRNLVRDIHINREKRLIQIKELSRKKEVLKRLRTKNEQRCSRANVE